jgi:hypothetical protein
MSGGGEGGAQIFASKPPVSAADLDAMIRNLKSLSTHVRHSYAGGKFTLFFCRVTYTTHDRWTDFVICCFKLSIFLFVFSLFVGGLNSRAEP